MKVGMINNDFVIFKNTITLTMMVVIYNNDYHLLTMTKVNLTNILVIITMTL